ncbi:thrombomodulin [Pygocentrus nattereri]|uniref:Thrombomodulin n=1 Tax=Pygocentrus nattereri TaxID=42514 RepID=A0AAR2KAS7_PYGNA|nr:thrombomodulin [Pygocentrus nattereri]
MKNFIGVVMAVVLLRVQGKKPNNGYCVQNSCFTVHTDVLDFKAAQLSCKNKQGSLMSVRTRDINDAISDLLTGFSGQFWIGLTHKGDRCTDSSLTLKGYTWITGDNTTHFKNWKSNDIACSPRCVSLSKHEKWTERLCNDTTDIEGYLCEYQNTKKCERLTPTSVVLYETPFGFSRKDLNEVPQGSNATRLDLKTKYICLEGEWRKAPWNCEVYKGGCEHNCDKRNDTYICTCPPGYKLETNAVSCEKAQDDPCEKAGCSHSCSPRGNNYECLCPSGYALDKDKKTCKDIDECDDKRLCPGKNFQCVNTDGSFECHCMNGFKKEQDTCVDIDECESGPCDHDCVNVVGSYHCECLNGYKVSPEDRHKCALYCPQWECPAVDCDPNNPHQCDCPRGFILDEREGLLFCTDINECDMLYCDQHCNNTIGGYNCSCYEGFNLIGNTKCEKTDISEEPHTTTFDIFTSTPTEVPPSISAGGLLGISVCTVVVILLMACLTYYLMKCCGKMGSVTLDKGFTEDVHGLQQVTTEKYTKKLSNRNIYINHNIQND